MLGVYNIHLLLAR